MKNEKMKLGMDEILENVLSFNVTFINCEEDGTWNIKMTHKNDSTCISQKFIKLNLAKATGK